MASKLNSYAGTPSLLVPTLTPFSENGEPDAIRYFQHCSWLLEQGAHGLVTFGTNSEANSLSVGERADMLEKLVTSGIKPTTLMTGTGCCAVTDTVFLSKHAIEVGCFDILVMPPFFFPCDEEGLFTYYSALIERIGDELLRLYLYHFPKMSRAPITPGLVGRLIERYPRVVVGIKDSAGIWEDTETFINDFPALDIYSSSEKLLPRNLKAGGGGCISATANVNAKGIRKLLDTHGTPAAEHVAMQAEKVRTAFEKLPLIAALKAYVAKLRDDPAWERPRPPLRKLASADATSLFDELAELGFLAD